VNARWGVQRGFDLDGGLALKRSIINAMDETAFI
jgi:hypothetical protein